MAKIVELIHVEVLIGDGSTEDPRRVEHQFWTKDGALILKLDSHHPGRPGVLFLETNLRGEKKHE